MSACLTCQQTFSLRAHIICCNKVAGLSTFAALKIAFLFKISIFSIKALLPITKLETCTITSNCSVMEKNILINLWKVGIELSVSRRVMCVKAVKQIMKIENWLNKIWRKSKIKEVRYSHQGAILLMVLVIFPTVKEFWRFLKVICWEIILVTVQRCRSCLEIRWSCAVHELTKCVQLLYKK